MRVGVPAEVKRREFRVACTPAGVHELTRAGHQVLVEAGAGAGSSLPDEEFAAAGATVVPGPDDVWDAADLVLKVEEPVPAEYARMRPGQILFGALHLAACRERTDALLDRQVTAIASETVQLPDGSLPLLAPMSEVAGRMAPQVGARHWRQGAGRDLHRVVRRPARVLVIGAGTAGLAAAAAALRLRSRVVLLDSDPGRLRRARELYRGRCRVIASGVSAVERAVLSADLVIGAALVPGARTPTVVGTDLVAAMKPGAVLVDIAIDQGGCFAGSRPTTHDDPVYPVHDTLFYCVPNMPGAVPHTSTYALAAATLPYAVQIANRGWRGALRGDDALARGLNAHGGVLTCAAVAESHGLPYKPADEVLGR